MTSSALAGYGTMVLNEVHTASLTPVAKAAIAQFVAGGGRLLIFDADETAGNDYSWLLGTPARHDGRRSDSVLVGPHLASSLRADIHDADGPRQQPDHQREPE